MRLPRFLANIVRAGESPEIVTRRNFDDSASVLEAYARGIEGHEIQIGDLGKKISRTTILLQILSGEVFNVKRYGAKGDGVTNDTAAIQATVAASAGADIVFPPGTYLVSSTVGLFTAGTRVFGYGAKIKRKDGTCTTHSPATSSYSYGFSPNNGQMFHIDVAGVEFYGLEIDGNKLNNISTSNDQGDGFELVGATRCVVEDCYIHDIFRDAITLGSVSDDNTIHNNRIFNVGYSSSVNGGNGVAITSGSRNIISNNHIKGDSANATQATSGIDIEPNAGTDVCTGNVIIGNTIDFVRLGQGMACYTSDANGPSYPSFGNIYKGNTVYASDSSKAGDYAFQGRNCSALIFEGNFLRHGATFCARIGGAYTKECKITGNFFKDSSGAGLQMPDSIQDCEVHGNHSINNAQEGFTFNGGNRLSLKGNSAIGNGTASTVGTQYHGFVLSGHANCIIEGNSAYLNYGHGMKLYAVTHTQVIGNQLLDNSQRADAESSALNLAGAFDYIDLVRNVVGSQAATTNWVKYGISESGSTTPGSLRFDSNHYESCRTAKTSLASSYILQGMDENYVPGGTMDTNTFLDLKSKFTISYGIGSPEGVVTGRPGSFFFRTDGAYGTTVYMKEKNTTANGWTPLLSTNGATPTDKEIPLVSGSDAYLGKSADLTFDDTAKILATGADVSITALGKGLKVKAGTNGRINLGVVMVGGTVTVANTSVTANTLVLPTRTVSGGTIGDVTVTKNAGVGYTLTSANVLDTSTYDCLLVEAT